MSTRDTSHEDPAPGRPSASNPVVALYELLGNTGFAIAILIALAVASIAGIVILEQLPVRGEMARAAYADRSGDPLIWLLIHVVPDRPFRCPGFQTLLALLSLSLLACTIKRWRRSWRLAFRLDPPAAGAFDGEGVVRWRTTREAPRLAQEHLRGRFFRLRQEESPPAGAASGPAGVEAIGAGMGREIVLSASRFAVSRLGPVLTHLGFLLLVVGAIVMGLSGHSQMLWLGEGEEASVPGSDLALRLHDFHIEVAPSGRIADYLSTVTLLEGGREVRQSRIEVNHPLRHAGYSFYQNSYRQNPTRLVALDLVTDAAAGDPPAPANPAGESGMMGPHGRLTQTFARPVTTRIPWGERVALSSTPYAVEIDTFLADFVIGDEGPTLASTEPRNPAVLLSFYQDGAFAGRSWYFAQHPGMAVGTAPGIPLMLGRMEADFAAGIEAATHPGSAWVWAGFLVMTLGTLLAFLLNHERLWLRLRERPDGWEVAVHHPGAPRMAPELTSVAWQRQASALTVELARRLEPEGPPPSRGPERSPA